MTAILDTQKNILPWKTYLITTIETIAGFYIATVCIAIHFTHRMPGWLLPGLVLIALYLFVITTCIRIIIKNLSIAALMLVIPIAPLLALISVMSLIPLLQYIK